MRCILSEINTVFDFLNTDMIQSKDFLDEDRKIGVLCYDIIHNFTNTYTYTHKYGISVPDTKTLVS